MDEHVVTGLAVVDSMMSLGWRDTTPGPCVGLGCLAARQAGSVRLIAFGLADGQGKGEWELEVQIHIL